MDNIQQYIQPELLITIPLLYFFGTQLKHNKNFPDSKIPVTLGGISVALSILYTFSTVPLHSPQNILQALFTGITQGLLCASTSVYTHQLMKQGRVSIDNNAAVPQASDTDSLPPPNSLPTPR